MQVKRTKFFNKKRDKINTFNKSLREKMKKSKIIL